MNKKFTYLFVALLCLLGGQSAWADSWNSDDGKLTFTTIDYLKVSVKASSKSIEGAIVVPQTTTYEGETYTVTQVAADGFYNVDGITSVSLPNSIEVIGSWAFGRSALLASVNIPQNVTTIENFAFRECPKLKSIVIPNSVYSIGDDILSGTSLDYFTFEDGDTYNNPLNSQKISAKNVVLNRNSTVTFTDIETLAIGGGVEYVADGIAQYAATLTTVTIGGNVHTIGTSAFEDCTNLTTVNITTDKLRSIYDYAFYNCQKLASFSIPAGTESIGERVFYQCVALKNMVIPSSVMYIGGSVFVGCSFNNFTFEDGSTYGNPLNDQTVSAKNVVLNRNSTVKFTGVESLTIGGGVEYVADEIARNATTLTSVTIGGNVHTIGTSAFEGCTNLVSVNITANVEQINDNAFWNCFALPEITIPATVWSIGERAFRGCTSLGDVTIPASVTSVNNIFADAVMNSLTIEANSETLGNLGAFTATDVVMNRKTPVNFTATNLTIGGAITAIEDQMFLNKTFKTVTINSPVETIGVEAFEKCRNLTSITLPNTLTTIRGGAFYDCEKLEAITIPASVTSIGRGVFYDTPMLKDFTFADGNENLVFDMNGYSYGTETPIESGLNTLYVGRNISSSNSATLVGSAKDITFGEGVTGIAGLFANTTGVENVHAPWATPITIAADEFSTTAKADATLWVPAGTKSLYEDESATGWKEFTTIRPNHYIVTLNTVGTGTVTLDGKTSGNVLVAYDATNIEFALAAGEDYDFTSLNNGTADVYTPASQGATKNGGTYTLANISDDMTFTATFTEKPKFNIAATAGVGGTVNVQGGEYGASKNAEVYRDRDAVVGVKCNDNYEIVSVVLDKDDVTSQLADGKLTIANIQGAHQVNVTFQKINLDVTLVATAGGSLTVGDKTATDGQNNTAVIARGQNVQMTATPDEDYDFAGIKKGDNLVFSGQRTGDTYTYENLQDEPTFTAVFTIKPMVTITASATNGTATPSEQQVRRDRNATVTLTPNAGHYLSALTVNGNNALGQQVGNTLTLSEIQDDQNVVATFTKYVYNVTAASATNGTINITSASVAWGDNTTATITPASGYMIDHVFINGVNADAQLAGNTLTINNVTANTEVSATFRILSYRVTITGEGVTADNMYPQHGQSVTITVAEDSDRELTSLLVNGVERKNNMDDNTYTINSVTGDVTVAATFRSTVESITVSALGIGTYACSQDLNFTGSDLKAYIAVGFNKSTGQVLLSRVYDVPAGTGIYLVAEEGTYKIRYSTSSSCYVNMLVGNTGDAINLPETTGDKTNYYLTSDGFIKSAGSATIPTNRAYLQIPTNFVADPAHAKVGIVFEDDLMTGIEEFTMVNKPANGRIYNINGQQVNKLGKGIFIINGKKFKK